MNARRILAIDDDISTLDILSIFFEKQNIDVVTAEDGQLGVEKMNDGPYSVIFLDLNMPNMGGLEALPLIHEKAGHAEIVIMTAHASYESKMSARELGIYDYMVKPITLAKLQELTEALIPDADPSGDMLKDEAGTRLGLDVTMISPEVVQIIPERVSRTLFLVAVAYHDNTLTIAMVDADDQKSIDQVHSETGLEVLTIHAERQDILDAIQLGYGEIVAEAGTPGPRPPDGGSADGGGSAADTPGDDSEAVTRGVPESASDPKPAGQAEDDSTTSFGDSLVGDAPEWIDLEKESRSATQVLQKLLADAIRQNARAIFIEPQIKEAVIRFRMDGPVLPYGKISKRTCSELITRVKEFARSQAEDSLSPAQGRFRVRI